MSLDQETLKQVAKDGTMDYERWPPILEPLLQRLDQIVHTAFPIPTIPPPDWLRPRSDPNPSEPSALESGDLDSPSQARTAQRPLPPIPPFDSSISTIPSRIPDSAPPSQSLVADSIPDLLTQQLASISRTLRTGFANQPPHTIQRLAELVLTPTKHYKTLPAWLRAVDRAVSVTSTADIFPLPQAQSLPQGVLDSALTNGETNGLGSGIGGGGILWTNSESRDTSLGSDESLGGALLTPIPWLKTGEIAGTTLAKLDPLDPIDPPSNAFVPEREDGAVTQGELIRMEQEAGIVPLSQTTAHGDVGSEGEAVDLVPHARGPDVVGVEDMGLQDGKDVEVQIGKGSPRMEQEVMMMEETKPGIEPEVGGPIMGEGGEQGEKAMPANGDGDIVLTDVPDGKPDESETKADSSSSGVKVRPETVDASTL